MLLDTVGHVSRYALNPDSSNYSKNLDGLLIFNKHFVHSLSKHILHEPTSISLFLAISSYIGDNNSFITNSRTLCELLDLEKLKVESCLRYLVAHGLIKIKKVKVHYSSDIVGKKHDMKLYRESGGKIWKVSGDKYICKVDVKGTFLKIYVDSEKVMCNNHYNNTFLYNIEGLIYHDCSLLNSEILEETTYDIFSIKKGKII